MRRSLALALLASMLALAACDGGEIVLVVDLKTDYVAGRQFFGVRTELGDADLASVRAREDTFATSGDSYLDGRRVAELHDLTPGTVAVRVSLLDATGETIAARTTVVTLSSQQALTVLITSSCQDVTCPGASDDPALSACVGGRCVDPRCSPETPEYCGPPGCRVDGDCESPIACASGVCVDSECFLSLDDARCGESELCDPQLGCVLRPDVDGGPGCPASETDCTDGVDDDCDGATDCADSECLDQSCDDGSVCTESDACAADGTCTGAAIACSDENPCTDDACDPVSGCTFTNNTASCDDGFWCDGPDQCADGACVAVGPPPCASFCNEAMMACQECASDTDCGTASASDWSACDYGGSTCAESGSQTRQIMTPRCNAGTCTVDTSTETQACTRNTDGTSCGSTTYTSWSACNYADACDESASQSRTRTEHHCASGACGSQNFSETRGCSRTVADGTSCGGTWRRCCSGHCRDLTSNAYCGGCGVSCSAIGLSCASTGTGGYSCRSCSTNSSCQSILNGSATCYNTASPPAWCQCQCASDGVCSNGGCGAGMYCHDCPGTNFCAPFGGSC